MVLYLFFFIFGFEFSRQARKQTLPLGAAEGSKVEPGSQPAVYKSSAGFKLTFLDREQVYIS